MEYNPEINEEAITNLMKEGKTREEAVAMILNFRAWMLGDFKRAIMMFGYDPYLVKAMLVLYL